MDFNLSIHFTDLVKILCRESLLKVVRITIVRKLFNKKSQFM
jgi:hypothetical protein